MKNYKLKKYPLRKHTIEDIEILASYEYQYQYYEVVSISVHGLFNKTIWVLYKKKKVVENNESN